MSLNRDSLRACVYLFSRDANGSGGDSSWCTRTVKCVYGNHTVKVHFSSRFLKYFEKMSDSETDSDLAVEQYDVEDDLNAYGSPVFQTVDKVKENLPIEGTTSTRTQVSFLYFLFTTFADIV